MRTTGRKEIVEAVLIAALCAAVTAGVNALVEILKARAAARKKREGTA